VQVLSCPHIALAYQRLGLESTAFGKSPADMYGAALVYDALLTAKALAPHLLSQTSANAAIRAAQFEGATGDVVWDSPPGRSAVMRQCGNAPVTVLVRPLGRRPFEPAAVVSFHDFVPVLSPLPGAPPIVWPDGSHFPPTIPTAYAAPVLPLRSNVLSTRSIKVISALSAAFFICLVLTVTFAVIAVSAVRRGRSKNEDGTNPAAVPSAPVCVGDARADAFGVAYLESLYGSAVDRAAAREPRRIFDILAAWLSRIASRDKRFARASCADSIMSWGPLELWDGQGTGSHSHGGRRARKSGAMIKRAGAMVGLGGGGDGSGSKLLRSHRSVTGDAAIAIKVLRPTHLRWRAYLYLSIYLS
jgi:hypothetical protein